MTLLFTLLTLAVLGVIAAVATGKIAGGLEDPSTSLPARGLAEGPVSAEGLAAVRFSPALRGYRMEEVDAVLDRLGDEVARRDREILQLSQELRLAERTYLRQAARAAANPEWVVPGAGQGLGTGAIPGPYPAEPYPAEPYPAEPYPAEPYPAEPYAGEPYRAPTYAAEPYRAPTYQPEPAPGYGQDQPPAAEASRPGNGYAAAGGPEPADGQVGGSGESRHR